jgi:hypothetical protein
MPSVTAKKATTPPAVPKYAEAMRNVGRYAIMRHAAIVNFNESQAVGGVSTGCDMEIAA